MKVELTSDKLASPCFIIAEAGVNHNGNMALAYRLLDAARNSGADAVKFQTFKAEQIATRSADMTEYQQKNLSGETKQFEMLKRLELSYEEQRDLKAHCEKLGMVFISSPFDFESIDFLNQLNIDTIKIPSGEVTNIPYLRRIAACGKSVILSTGMCDLDEVSRAVEVLRSGGIQFSQLILLQCNTEYPTPVQDVNLKVMETFRNQFPESKIGLSDHTEGIVIPVAAVAMGAQVIEKHFTLDRGMEGPDHRASLVPEELKQMVQAIREVEAARGDGIKRPSPSEIPNISKVRKSIVARTTIQKGEEFTEKNITVKRPGTGIPAVDWDKIIGKVATRSYERDEFIQH